jgi:hypothetical protein
VLPKQNWHLLLQSKHYILVWLGYIPGEQTYLHILFCKYRPVAQVTHPLEVWFIQVLQVWWQGRQVVDIKFTYPIDGHALKQYPPVEFLM